MIDAIQLEADAEGLIAAPFEGLDECQGCLAGLTPGMPSKKKAIKAHDPIDPFVVHGGSSIWDNSRLLKTVAR